MTLTTAPGTGHATFLCSERATGLDTLQADIALLGISHGDAAVGAGYVEKPAS